MALANFEARLNEIINLMQEVIKEKKELEAEVSRLKSELKVAQNNLAHLGRYQMEVSRLTEENEKLKDRQRQSCTDCEEKIALENDQLRARVAELERKNGNQQDTIRRAFDGLPADIEARIAAIEKWLGQKFQVIENGKIVSEFKPGGEGR